MILSHNRRRLLTKISYRAIIVNQDKKGYLQHSCPLRTGTTKRRKVMPTKQTCPKCGYGTDNPWSNYCFNCGTKHSAPLDQQNHIDNRHLGWHICACGNELWPEMNFCPNCGKNHDRLPQRMIELKPNWWRWLKMLFCRT